MNEKNKILPDFIKKLDFSNSAKLAKAIGDATLLGNPLVLHKNIKLDTITNNLKLFANKLSKIQDFKIVRVPPEISNPTIEKLFYTTNEELVNLFTNLLARSSNSDECNFAHPNFVNIIASISPDEAKIVNHKKGTPIEIIYPKIEYTETENNENYFVEINAKEYLSNIQSEIELIFPSNLKLYVKNLTSLGILKGFGARFPDRLRKTDNFKILKNKFNSEIEQFYADNKNILDNSKLKARKEIGYGYSEFTEFGVLFVKACCN